MDCTNPWRIRLRTVVVKQSALLDETRKNGTHRSSAPVGAALPLALPGRRERVDVPRARATANMWVLEGEAPIRPARPSGATGHDGAALEAELLAAVALGDRQAFSSLYDLLVGKVHGVVLGVLRDPAQSEEVTQEVMVEVWRSAARFDSQRGSVRAWAATLAHRRAVDRVRSSESARRREQAEVAESPDRIPAHEEPSEVVAAGEQKVIVAQALARLTENQRKSIELAYFGGHTYREVAQMLEVPEGTVKTRIRDGLTKLRSMMEVDHV